MKLDTFTPSVVTQAELVGTGAVGSGEQGQSVALSGDGNTAIVGGPGDNSGGAAWVFTRSNGVWTQQGSKLVGVGWAGDAEQGISVALSGESAVKPSTIAMAEKIVTGVFREICAGKIESPASGGGARRLSGGADVLRDQNRDGKRRKATGRARHCFHPSDRPPDRIEWPHQRTERSAELPTKVVHSDPKDRAL